MRLWHTGRQDEEKDYIEWLTNRPGARHFWILILDSLLTHHAAMNKRLHLYITASHKQGDTYLVVSQNVVKIINKCLESTLNMKGQIHSNG